MRNLTGQHIRDLIGESRSVFICGHIRPDGDCTGASLGLYLYMKEQFPSVETDLYLEEVRPAFRVLKGWEYVRTDIPAKKRYDLFICLDCGDVERIGEAASVLSHAARSVCIDHHCTNRAFADENYIVPDASSTSELVCGMLDEEKISIDVAEALYMGIVHDTGVFQYDCTSPETMRTAAVLLEKGVRASMLIDQTYFEKTFIQNRLLGYALEYSELVLDGKCIISRIPLDEMTKWGAGSGDLDGIVSQLRVTKGVEIAVFMYETSHDSWKISLRSKRSADVSRVAAYFGGGGHKKAAGCTCRGTYADVTEQLLMKLADI